MTSSDFKPGDYAAGYDAASYTHDVTNNLVVEAVLADFHHRAEMFAAIAAADERRLHFESAAYKAGVAYAYRQAAADLSTLRVQPRPARRPAEPVDDEVIDAEVVCTCGESYQTGMVHRFDGGPCVQWLGDLGDPDA
ncbi:hypothetical protein [Gordonia sp. MMO-8]|uniref:hypothetical protein n=1 Tax=Gordonia sp. MMO-8 TaxID=3127886 RepID=UPI0030171CE9